MFVNGQRATLSFLRAARISSRLRGINPWFFESRENFVPITRYKSVLHLRDEDELFVFVNAHEQRIEPGSTGNVTANNELLLSVRAMLDPRA